MVDDWGFSGPGEVDTGWEPTDESGDTEEPFDWTPGEPDPWTMNRCATMFTGWLTVTQEIVDRFPAMVLPEGVHIGDTYPVSIHPVRAMAENNPLDYSPDFIPHQGHLTAHPEACRYHMGRLVVYTDDTGENAHVAMCGMPVENDVFWKQTSIARLFVQHDRRPYKDQPEMHAGDTYGVAAYQTPRLLDAVLMSDQLVCGAPI